MEQLMKNNKLCFSSKTENITLVENVVNDVCGEYGLGDELYGNILVAVSEAVTNAIQHGNKFDPQKNIELEHLTGDKCLLFRVVDDGEGFDFDNLPDPTDPANIEKPHGRGVFLMRNLADEVSFFDNGRMVELKFNL